MVGRNRFFFRSGGVRPVSLGGGLEAWKGFYSSVRPAWKQLMVNVNACTTAFYQPRNLAVAMIEFEQSSFGAQPATFVRGVRVKTTHLGYKKTVKKLARTTARLHKFDSGDFGTVTVEQYFKKSTFVPLDLVPQDTNDELQSTTSPFPTPTSPSWMLGAPNRISSLLKSARYFRINPIVANSQMNIPPK